MLFDTKAPATFTAARLHVPSPGRNPDMTSFILARVRVSTLRGSHCRSGGDDRRAWFGLGLLLDLDHDHAELRFADVLE